MSTQDLPDQAATRFRLPVRLPLREFFIASSSAVVGSGEVILWAALGLRRFVLAAGVALILVGVGMALWCLLRQRSQRWVLYVGVDTLAIVRGSRRRVFDWHDVGDVRVLDNRLVVFDRSGGRLHTLAVARGVATENALPAMLAAISERLSG